MLILVVDDSRQTARAVRNLLTEAGYEVRCAADGREALGVLREVFCPIVISDWEMEPMSGLELCRTIRRTDFPGPVHFIMLTGRSTPEEMAHALAAGADHFIAKPYLPTDLLTRVREAERRLNAEG